MMMMVNTVLGNRREGERITLTIITITTRTTTVDDDDGEYLLG